MTDFQSLVVASLVSNGEYCRKVIPHLRREYFEEPHLRSVFDSVCSLVAKYNQTPIDLRILELEYATESRATPPDVRAQALAFITRDVAEGKPVATSDLKWLVDSTESWCKDRAVHLAVMEAISILDTEKNPKDPRQQQTVSKDAIPSILSKALAVSFDTSIGHDYIADAANRFDFYHLKEDRIPFDLSKFNDITKGGVSKQTLNCILAGCVHPSTRIKVRLRSSSSEDNSSRLQHKQP